MGVSFNKISDDPKISIIDHTLLHWEKAAVKSITNPLDR